MEPNKNMDQLNAFAMHITDNYMSSVVAKRDQQMTADYYAELYFNSYEMIKKTVYSRNGFAVPKQNPFDVSNDVLEAVSEDSLSSRFK